MYLEEATQYKEIQMEIHKGDVSYMMKLLCEIIKDVSLYESSCEISNT